MPQKRHVTVQEVAAKKDAKGGGCRSATDPPPDHALRALALTDDWENDPNPCNRTRAR